MPETSRPIDPERLGETAKHVFGLLNGAVTSALVYLGDELGLYRGLAEHGPTDSEGLAAKLGLSERWVREWLHNQAAARLVEHEDGRFSLTPEAVAVLADENHPAFGAGMFTQLPIQLAVAERLRESFKTGQGLPYDAFGPDGARGVERGFAPWVNHFLVPVGVGAIQGLRESLEAGVQVADVGCGGGAAILKLAEAFPNSEFHGYEISEHALARAEENRSKAGGKNVQFHDARTDPLPEDGRFDLVLTFDCLHDMAHPERVIAQIRKAIARDGVWMIADIKAHATFAENVERNPMASLMYGFSVLTCMSSALSEPDGAGLGTLGLHARRCEEMVNDAGFTRFDRLEIDHPVNAFYEVRV
ncbi:MAG: methyltransferase domain-containing protein [Deltaproteobacteria bacterium]|nr:methyltransferase domain-containing protein [Deltaproteobacteria bacterium]MBW2393892.1 methyltransferase domain-containing protein [Deltaproteobacteria bacterium]